MEYTKACNQCGIQYKSKRADSVFCTDKCAAQWARDQGYFRQTFHAEKDEWLKKNCAYCNVIFTYNEYAKRTGTRVPQYCSNKCRQAAYRERKAAQGESAGYTGHWDDARNDKSEKGTSQDTGKKSKSRMNDDGEPEYSDSYAGKGTSQDKKANKGTSQSKPNKGTQPNPEDKRFFSKDAYEILGVTYLTPIEQVQKAWKKLLRTYHPDVSKHPQASEIAKAINWAWDRISNPKTRK